jgi:hypothetical protein
MNPEERRVRLQHEAQVKRVLSATSAEDVLLIETQEMRTLTTSDIQTRFRDLAALVHPDKNPATRASEAFNKLQESKETLLQKVKSRSMGGNNQTSYTQTGGFSRPTPGAATTAPPPPSSQRPSQPPPTSRASYSTICTRCGYSSHTRDTCWAKYHINGYPLYD